MRQAGRFTGFNLSPNAWDDKIKTEATIYANNINDLWTHVLKYSFYL
jgi:hypothetical protein